jgi:hypothetical protein
LGMKTVRPTVLPTTHVISQRNFKNIMSHTEYIINRRGNLTEENLQVYNAVNNVTTVTQ